MITTFKIFENSLTKKLVNQFDDDFILYYFNKNFSESAKDIIDLWPSTIWKYVDDDKYIEDLMDSEKQELNINDFNDDDYKKYIIDNISDKKENMILKLYNKKKHSNEIEYDDDMLDDLSEKQLRKIIEKENEEIEFVNYSVDNRYKNKDAQEIIKDEWGISDGLELYKILSNYIDDDKIESDYINDSDKESRLEEEICSDKLLQTKLLGIKKSNVFLLAKLFIKNSTEDTICNEYNFQKIYIEKYVKKNKENIEQVGQLRAIAIRFLNDNFELNEDIQEEYKDDMWLIKTDKYNI